MNTIAQRHIIEHAAALLESVAIDIRLANSVGGTGKNWLGDAAAKKSHADFLLTARQLHRLSDEICPVEKVREVAA